MCFVNQRRGGAANHNLTFQSQISPRKNEFIVPEIFGTFVFAIKSS